MKSKQSFLFQQEMNTIKVNSVTVYRVLTPIPVAARYKAWVCGCSLVGIPDSKTARGVDVYLVWVLCVYGRVFCVGLITRPEESYRLWWVSECDREASILRRRRPTRGCCDMKNNIIITNRTRFYCNIELLCECVIDLYCRFMWPCIINVGEERTNGWHK